MEQNVFWYCILVGLNTKIEVKQVLDSSCSAFASGNSFVENSISQVGRAFS